MRGQTRRSFLKRLGSLGAASAFARAGIVHADDGATTLPALGSRPSTGFIDEADKSIVARVRRPEVMDRDDVHETLLGEMIEDGVMAATGQTDPGDAWHQLLKPDDIIAVKFNHVGFEAFGTGAAMARQLVASLGKADFAPERIMLIEAPPRLARDLKTRPRTFGWSEAEVAFPSGTERLAAFLDEVTAVINVPFLKTHNIAGMTGCLKNLSHALVHRPSRYHANACTPYVGEIVALPQIRPKLRLHVVNAVRALCDGGPAVQRLSKDIWDYGGLLISTDPVAADAVGINAINDQRERVKLPPIGDHNGHIPHVHHAASINLGTDDQDYITIVDAVPA